MWEKLCSGGGEEGQCGWCKDKFGLSWQVGPRMLERLAEDRGKVQGFEERSGRVMRAIMGMRKIIIADLQAAVDATS